MNKDKAFWDHVYTGQSYHFGKEPNPFLLQMLPRLRKGRVLDVAMGEGQNAVYLALKGFEVVGFDISENSVAKASQLAQSSGVQIDAQSKNVDFYLFPLMAFDTIVMTFFKPIPRYFSEIRKSLTQGGTFLCVGFLSEQMGQKYFGDEVTLEECYKPNELLQHLTGLRILFYEEGEENGVHMVKCLAQKPQEKDAVKYGFAKGDAGHKSAQERAAEELFKKK